MKGLLVKDLINLRALLKIYGAIVVVWFFISLWNGQPEFFSGIMVMFVVMIPITTLSYDDSCKWDLFAVASPVSRKQIVLSKYILMMIALVLSAGIAFAGNLLMGESPEESLFLATLLFPFGIIIGSVVLPIIFKLGAEKGRFVFVAVIAVIVALVSFAGPKLTAVLNAGEFLDTAISMGRWTWLGILTVAAVGLGLISMWLSGRIYAKKEF